MSIYLGSTKISGAYTIAKNIGEVFYSQSSSAADNPGGLPLFTGETISNADQLYPQFYNWVLNHSELCTTNSEYETSMTNWGRCSYYVINDTTKIIRLPKLSSNNRYLIDSYSSGTAWYNIYSDGWCEQGNFFTGVTGTQTITLEKPFLNTDYSLSLTESYTGTLGDRRTINNANKTISSFQIFAGSASTVGFYWEAKGYVDVSDYKKKEIYPWVFAYNTAISASMAQAAEFQTALSSKVDTDLANITNNGKQVIVNSLMPDYENVVSVDSVARGTYTQVVKDSFVVTWGNDPYTEDYYVYVSPDNGVTEYIVGRRYDDENGQTEAVSFSFFVPKGWYFTNNTENGYSARIYPLKGAQ